MAGPFGQEQDRIPLDAFVTAILTFNAVSVLIGNWKKFYYGLNCPLNDIVMLEDRYKMGVVEINELFSKIIGNWVATNADPTIRRLHTILEKEGFQAVADDLKKTFPLDSKIFIRL